MWAFLSTLAGGVIALLGSVTTTFYVQRAALKAERRARSERAADEIMTAVIALRAMPGEPETGEPGSPGMDQWGEWDDRKDALIYQIQAQALLLPSADMRERITFAAGAMLSPGELASFEGFTEAGARYALCREVVDCLGAYYRGEPMPLERTTTKRARSAIAEARDLEHPG